MYFEINVSLNGEHFFATAERSITSAVELGKVYREIAIRFPASDGFEIEVSQRFHSGTHVAPEVLAALLIATAGR